MFKRTEQPNQKSNRNPLKDVQDKLNDDSSSRSSYWNSLDNALNDPDDYDNCSGTTDNVNNRKRITKAPIQVLLNDGSKEEINHNEISLLLHLFNKLINQLKIISFSDSYSAHLQHCFKLFIKVTRISKENNLVNCYP